jgi:predicted XRE-type DNA-binding protein
MTKVEACADEYGIDRGGADTAFRDPCFADADELAITTRPALALNAAIDARKLRQVEAAALIGDPQPKVSVLRRCRLGGFSVERILHFLTRIGVDMEIVIRTREDGSPGAVTVIAMR